VRDKGNAERLKAVSHASGCQACHTHMSCTRFCPKAIAPTYSIAGLKRAVLRRNLGFTR
jgi:fumarate reductase iron-sulfur subunit